MRKNRLDLFVIISACVQQLGDADRLLWKVKGPILNVLVVFS